MAMLEGLTELTLDRLNEETLAWITKEYNREKHEEIGVPPLRRYTEGPSVGRTSPGSEQLRRAFKVEETRTQRRSDGTVGVARKRFEVPSRFRHVEKVTIRYARWDLSTLDMIDPRTKVFLAALYPQDKARNGDGHRRRHDEVVQPPAPSTPPTASGMAPLLEKLVNEYRACGLPPAYLPHYGTPEETK